MTKIKSVSIYGFRGIRNRVVFDLSKKSKSLVLSAENGRGKSSLADAIEWYFQDTISHLRKEGCYESSYRHYRLPQGEDSVVEIVTTNPDVFGQKQLQLITDPSGADKYKAVWQNSGTALASFIENSQGENVILRHAELKDFVNKTKTEKLKAVSSIIGFDVVTQTRDVINKVKGSLEKDSDYRKIQGQILEKERDIETIATSIVGTIVNYSSAILAAAEQLRQQLGGRTFIESLESLQKSLEELNATPQDEKGKQLQILAGLESTLSQSSISANLVSQIQSYSQNHKLLLSKKENLEKLTLLDLYQSGTNIIEENPDLNVCPLCEREISTEDLLEKLKGKLVEFSEIKLEIENTRKQADDVRQKVLSAVKMLQGAMQQVSASKTIGQNVWMSSVDGVTKKMKGWADTINQSFESRAFEILNEDLSALQEYNIETDKLAKSVQLELEKISDTEADKLKTARLQSLKNLSEHYIRWLELKSKEKQFRRQIKSLEDIISSLEQRERIEFNKALSSISDEVNDFYKALHPNEGFDLLRLIPTTDRGLEFEFYFKGDRITPPNKFMSESHLNTLGLCFFLASAVEFNKQCEFVVLDDIVSSVDADHRLAFAKLIRDDPRLNQKQFVILSHDMHWSEILRVTFPSWIHKKIQNWDYDTGISLDDNLDLREQIDDAIQRGYTVDAARKTRDLVDATFREITEHYNISLPYRQGTANEKRELKAFISAVAQFFGRNNVFDAKQPPLRDIENSLWLMNIASHPDPRKLNLSMNDVKIILSDLEKFVNYFYIHAPKCKHKQKKLEWDSSANQFVSCKTCQQPL